MKLLIAIPALNEEQSIEAIIRRCLDARGYIESTSPVTEVEITVVSDGSTDRTLDLARNHDHEINVIGFEHNRGYGAAIQEAWRQSDAELLGFLDADGTCDPRFFSTLCNAIYEQNADVAIGCRLNAQSQMPLVRRIGNTMFALLLGLFSSTRVRDTASGMRVVRRESLRQLEPLPTGMHFTPAMSARAMLDRSLKIREIDMPYAEREGRSKLKLVSDGLRFLRVIVEAAMLYRPERPLSLMGFACLVVALALMVSPTAYYLRNHSVAEWMIYRFIVSHLAAIAACMLFSASYVTARIIGMTLGSAQSGPVTAATKSFLHGRYFWFVPTLLVIVGGAQMERASGEIPQMASTSEPLHQIAAGASGEKAKNAR